jgi:TonB-dependent SusC/RagA subfamily outer membrane receptor
MLELPRPINNKYVNMKRGIAILMMLILPLSGVLLSQKAGKKYIITGQVLDAYNKPVTDAIILIDNKNTKATTNEDGMFKVRVKPDATAITVFKPINGEQEEKISGRTIINFRLPNANPAQTKEAKVNPENDEVNIGYGTTSKRNISTSTAKIEGNTKEFLGYQNIYEMLQRDPSVQVTGTKIVIRGVGTINANDPLLVVDGMIVSTIDYIRPQMVKKIEILKGSDASIYGARGANGVILITLVH